MTSNLQIRKIVRHIDETLVEGGRPADPPLKLIAVAYVIKNPWADEGFVENLREKILEVAPALGEKMVPDLLELTGGGDKVEAYGKAAVCGMHGEVEHASGIIHQLRFGNQYRDAVKGTSYLSFTNKRGGPGCAIAIPMMHKEDEGLRSHYLTLEFTINDAPGADELVIALGAATSGRPNARIGNRYMDMEDMGITKNHSHS